MSRYCNRCVHGVKAGFCPIFSLHMDWNYDAAGANADATKRHALDTLWPRDGVPQDNGECALFFAAKEEMTHEKHVVSRDDGSDA